MKSESRGAVHSESLEAFVTSREFGGRLLGQTKTLTSPNNMLVAMTGNNAELGVDLARRAYPCTLDANTPNPELRTFRRELPASVLEPRSRAALLGAALTLTRAWVVAGRLAPDAAVPQFGGFEQWRHVVGGILGHAGVPGFLGNRSFSEHVVEESGWDGVVAEWFGKFGSEWKYAKDLVTSLLLDGVGIDEGGEAARRAALGRALRSKKNAWIGAYRIEAKKDRTGVAQWRVHCNQPQATVESPMAREAGI